VVIPVSCYVNEVNVGALANFLVTIFAVVDVSGSETSFAEVLLEAFSTGFFVVTKRNDFYTGDVSETHYSPFTAHTETNESNAYSLDGIYLQAKSVLLTSGAFG
jgi:hypothetical protein